MPSDDGGRRFPACPGPSRMLRYYGIYSFAGQSRIWWTVRQTTGLEDWHAALARVECHMLMPPKGGATGPGATPRSIRVGLAVLTESGSGPVAVCRQERRGRGGTAGGPAAGDHGSRVLGIYSRHSGRIYLGVNSGPSGGAPPREGSGTRSCCTGPSFYSDVSPIGACTTNDSSMSEPSATDRPQH